MASREIVTGGTIMLSDCSDKPFSFVDIVTPQQNHYIQSEYSCKIHHYTVQWNLSGTKFVIKYCPSLL
jgi:hypothetical protein